MSKRVLAIIPARGGSKGIHKKNMVMLAGKPLLQWTLEAAKKAKGITEIVVTSDDSDILAFVRQHRTRCIERPAELATDDARSEPVITHAISFLRKQNLEFDGILLLQPTSPLRTSAHIDEAIGLWMQTSSEAVISVTEPAHHPMKAFIAGDDGHLVGMIDNDTPFKPRQALPQAYFPNGAIYLVDTSKYCESESLFQNRTIPYVMSVQDSRDIDSIEDLVKVEKLFKRRLQNIKKLG